MDECVPRLRSGRRRGPTAAAAAAAARTDMRYEPRPDGTINVQRGSQRLGVIEWDAAEGEWMYRHMAPADRMVRYSALDLTSIQQKLLHLPAPSQPPQQPDAPQAGPTQYPRPPPRQGAAGACGARRPAGLAGPSPAE